MAIITGIYKIENLVNGKIYIGSSIDIQKRWRDHKNTLNRNTHHNGRLQNAWNKYGADCFRFTIIEICFNFVLLSREQYYMDTLKPFYNISLTAGNCLGVKHTAETRAKVSIAGKGRVFSDEHKKNLSLAMKGLIKSKEHCAHLSASKKGKTMSDEFKSKMRERMKGNNYALGNKFTDEEKAKVSDGLKKARDAGKVWGWIKKKQQKAETQM